MQDDMYIVRNMVANHAMIELDNETRKLFDKYGFDGAQAYLSWQMHLLRQMCDDEKKEGDDFGDEL